VYLCRDVPEGKEVLARSQELLEPAGFTLKGEDGVQDLRQGQLAPVLGFRLSKRAKQLHFEPGPDSWTKLEQNLVMAIKHRCLP
jgi:hypothetical protein